MTRGAVLTGWGFALVVALPLVAPEGTALGAPATTAAIAGLLCALAGTVAAAGAGGRGRDLLVIALPPAAAAAWLSPAGAVALLPVAASIAAAALLAGAAHRLESRHGAGAARTLSVAAWAALVVPLVWAGALEVAGLGPAATADAWRDWTLLGTRVPPLTAMLPLAVLGASALVLARGREAAMPALGAVVGVLACGAAWPQQPPPVPGARVTIAPVLGACYRPGYFLPLRVEVRAGAAAVRGLVRLVPDGGWPVEVPVDVPAAGLLRTDVRVVGHGSVLRVRVETPPGVTAPDALEFAAPAAGIPLTAFVRGTGEPAPGPGVVEPRVGGPLAHLDEGDLPADVEAFDALDLVVLGRVGGAAMPAARVRGLVAWVAAGGRLLLSDPDVLRRVPALDAALFAMVPPEEGPGLAVPGLPPAHRAALRRRGIASADCHRAAAGVPAFATFTSGRGRGLLVLPDDDASPAVDLWNLAPAAWLALRVALGTRPRVESPGLLADLVAALPAPAPGGPARLALAGLLLAWAAVGAGVGRARTVVAVGAVVLATSAATALAAAATSPVALAAAVCRPADGRDPLGPRSLALEWLVQVGAPRPTTSSVALGPADEARPVLRRLAEAEGLAGRRRHGEHPAVEDLRPGPGRPATLAVTRLAHGPAVVAVRTGALLIVSNRTSQPVPMMLHARDGRVLVLGPLGPGATLSRGVGDAARGPLAALEAAGEAAGADVALALRLALARGDAGGEAIYAVLPEAPGGPPPAVAGARLRILPAVCVVPVEAR